MQFRKYQHVERLGSQSVSCLLDGRVYIFPKMDGANASVWLEDGEIKTGSRNRELDVKNNLSGFYEYVMNHAGIKLHLSQYPDITLYGEWLIPHTIKDYTDTSWKQFYVFDVVKVDGSYVHYKFYSQIMEMFGINYLKPLAVLDFPKIEDIVKLADLNNVLMKDGKIGEGVVCKNYDYKNRYGNVIWGKYVRPVFKAEHSRTFNVKPPEDKPFILEEKMVKEVITYELVQKEKAKILEHVGVEDNRIIPMALGIIWYCLITEELADLLKKYRNPTVDFRLLNKFCNEKVKEYLEVR